MRLPQAKGGLKRKRPYHNITSHSIRTLAPSSDEVFAYRSHGKAHGS